jgi:hypothetical protein
MKKTLYSDEWGEIREYTRYRGKKGRFISEKYARRQLKVGGRRIVVEVEQWRIVEKKRTERILRSTPSLLMKETYPGSVADNEGKIYESLEQMNVFTQISKAQTALINIRGTDQDGRSIRLQSEINIGDRNQAQQLTFAVRELMANEGYRTNYNLAVVRQQKARNRAKQLTPLIDTQFAITLLL